MFTVQEALVKIELLEKGLSSVKEHGIDPPRLEDFTGLVDEVCCHLLQCICVMEPEKNSVGIILH